MPHNSLDVVVVDDNATLLGVLSEIFKEPGYSVRTASDGLGALAEIRKQTPDILLSDLNMPHMSGFELLSIVRRRYPRIKVIAMSASYSGRSVPRDVAADAFYEKGATGIARLLKIVNAMKDESEWRSLRVSTPLWVPRSSMDPTGGSSPLFACPECLRASPHSINGADYTHHRDCPYCLYRVQLAVVPAIAGIDNPSFIDFNA